jgi:predicted alpha/beta-hydrolase family hydrolase
MGKPDDVAGYSLSKRIEVLWMEAGDHSFKPTKASGRTNEQAIGEAIAAVVAFAKKL